MNRNHLICLVVLCLLITTGCVTTEDTTVHASPAAEIPTEKAIGETAVPATTPPVSNDNETAVSPTAPATPVKLIFIHHSTGGNWLADPNEDGPYGGLGIALRDNNYYVSATNYGWGPNSIGDSTDIINWPQWVGDTAVMNAVYTESGQNIGDFGAWSRLPTDPGGENKIIIFKSCFPNSDLYGSPNDPAYASPNDWEFSVGNAKAIYNQLRDYFQNHPEKLFILITSPPLAEGEYTMNDPDTPAAERAANARAVSDWLLNDWLEGYPLNNVGVFDYYTVLTSNGSPSRLDDTSREDEPNDLGMADGNHHRWNGSSIEHIQTISNNFAAYPSYSGGPDYFDSHPTSAGHQKATAEFLPLLNIYYNRWQNNPPPVGDVEVYLPIVTTTPSVPPPTGNLVQATDLVYLGAFRLPGGDEPPLTFAYGGNAMTFNPDGDPANNDAFPGSLFIMGHDRQAWGSLPNGNQVAEVSIPIPAQSVDPTTLPQAAFVQDFHDAAAGFFTELEEIPKVGLQYLNYPTTGPLLHIAWGQHLQPDDVASHGWFNPTLDTPDLQGTWFIGDVDLYSTTGYLFDIPAEWADAYVNGRYLATGRMRDGGQGGMGPAIVAYRPWHDDGSPPPAGTHLAETTLLLYENAYNTEDIVRSLNGYQHPDEWEGAAWLTTTGGKTAVLFAGTKSNGSKYWYGYRHPDGADLVCVDAHITDFPTCRMADGTACPSADLAGCCDADAGTCISLRGWWTTRFDAQFILYNPADLAQVAAGTMASWEPQPYAVIDIDEHLYLNPTGVDIDMLGAGDQRRARIGDVAYDRANGLLYVLELWADEAKPVVHVWRIA